MYGRGRAREFLGMTKLFEKIDAAILLEIA